MKKYSYRRYMGRYNVYEDDGTGICKKIEEYRNEEEARRKVYRLNGWKYKPLKQKNDE